MILSPPDQCPRGRNLKIGAWRSLVAHLLWEQRVGSSNLSAPTSFGFALADIAPVAQPDRALAF
jgi:hypothetical protein